ncbi:hypothetical protein MNBD_PLANCTO03-1045, partial [hydrothermal vent metagenome]
YCKSCAMDRAARHTTEETHLPPPEDDANPYAIDDGDSEAAALLPAGMLDLPGQQGQCPGCMHLMPPGTKICISCGYNIEKGIQSSTKIERSAGKGGRKYRCRECGYDLQGLRSQVCPKCGTRIRLSKTEKQERLEREVVIQEWKKPAIWFAIGFTGMMILYAGFGGIEAMIAYPILLGFQVVLGYCVLWLCFNFLGDIGTPLLNLVRLAGIYTLVDLIGVATGFIPIIGWLIQLLAYIGLFSTTFETDLQDAFLVIVLTWIVKVAFLILLAMYFPDLLAGL